MHGRTRSLVKLQNIKKEMETRTAQHDRRRLAYTLHVQPENIIATTVYNSRRKSTNGQLCYVHDLGTRSEGRPQADWTDSIPELHENTFGCHALTVESLPIQK